MTRAISYGEFRSAAVAGVCKAQEEYKVWSGGDWLWTAPEYLTTVFVAQTIARKLKRRQSWYLTLEHGATKAITAAAARGRGKLHKHMRPAGRFDLLVWWGGEKPRGVVEIKRHVTQFSILKADCLRIEKVLHRSRGASSFQFGLIVFYSSAKAETALAAAEKLNGRVAKIVGDAEGGVTPATRVECSRSRIHMDSTTRSAWIAVAIQLTPVRAKAARAAFAKPRQVAGGE